MAQPSPGPMVTNGDVAAAVRDTMREWVPFYLAQVDDDHDLERGTTAPPRLWLTRSELGRFADEEPPILIVACPGTIGDPVRHKGSSASYGAWFQVNIGVTAGGATEDGSYDLADRLGAAVLYTVAQQGDMGGLAAGSVWKGNRSDPVPPARRLMASETLVHVFVDRIVDSRGVLPRAVPPDPTDPADPTPTPSGVRVSVTRRTA